MSEIDRATFARELASSIEGEVRFGLHDRMLYATDASLYQVEPIGVVVPASIEDAVRAVELCAQRGVPILPRGGGTSLAGQCTSRAVVIDFSPNCRAIREIDAAGRRCVVEPGITIDDLNESLASSGLFFAPDPATSRQANIGGCIGNNAAGARTVRYGRTSENLIGVEALLADGRRVRLAAGSAARDRIAQELGRRVAEVVWPIRDLIRARYARTPRRNAGYNLDLILDQMESAGPRADADAIYDAMNLSHLVCGSEGTLALTLAAELRLHRRPRAKGLALIGLPTVEAAIDAVAPILETGPSAVELLDDVVLGLARRNSEYKNYVELMPPPAAGALGAVLYVEYFADDDPGELSERFEALRRVVARVAPGAGFAAITDPTAMARAWKLRKAGEPLLHGMPGDRKPITFVEDNAVPVERLGEFVRRFKQIVAKHGTAASFWAHASVGVLHVRPFLDLHDEADKRRIHEIAVEVADLAKELGGVMSGEHGDGRVRGPLLERFYGPEIMAAFRAVKAVFDPRNLLNPGNIVEPGPIESITQHTRLEPTATPVAVPGVETFFSYDDQHGFGGAVEMCNGAGVCRKKSGGTMCPSYMATLDERHSTRGRGNALRLAITGQLAGGPASTGSAMTGPMDVWSDAETIRTLDLCLSCKACKAECPSNVDIARLKAEYTGQRYRRGGTPIAARLMANVRTLNRMGSLAPGLANWLSRRRPARWAVDRVLGIDPRRSLPEFATPLSRGFEREFSVGARVTAADERGRDKSPSDVGRGPIVALFGDCFTMYSEPRIGRAAARVVRALGYNIQLIDAGCCGRAMISLGVMDDAIAAADGALLRLRPVIEDPRIAAVLVAEPSCLSAIKDDWLQLKLRTPIEIRRALAAKAMLPEEFIERRWKEHPRPMDFSAPNRGVILHGHCHQKALWGVETSAAALRRAGARVNVLDSGCCGMAGSFGYTRERYDLSMRIGELVLLPAVRAAGPDAAIAVPGTSCRHQIKDGAGVEARHPIEWLAEWLPADAARK